MSEHLLLTGATGLLGRYLLRDLLLEGMPLAVLARSRERDGAAHRVDRIVRHWEAELGRPLPRPVCLEGDITSPGLGLSAEATRWVADHCRAVLHSAASLTFYGSDRTRDPWLSNLTGTGHVLDLCRRTGLRELHYVSTAYVCGRRPGPVLEDELDAGQEFRNDYERCKCEAERTVRAADFLSRLTVYRPAIIVGDSRTGYTSTYHGLYPYLQYVWLLRRYAALDKEGRWDIGVRLNLTGDEVRNLVPVDWVSAVMTRILIDADRHGRTYHLAPDQPADARELEAAMAELFNYYGAVFAGPDALTRGELTENEKSFYQYVERYSPYWEREPVFDCRNTRAAVPDLPCPRVDLPVLRRLIDFAVRDRWGKGKSKRASGDGLQPAAQGADAAVQA